MSEKRPRRESEMMGGPPPNPKACETCMFRPTEDTSLTLCLADSLSLGFSPDGIARNFVKWYDEAAFTAHGEVFDIGISTAKAINRLKAGVAPDKVGCAGVNENGNGSLMRIAPLVFYLTNKPEAERF